MAPQTSNNSEQKLSLIAILVMAPQTSNNSEQKLSLIAILVMAPQTSNKKVVKKEIYLVNSLYKLREKLHTDETMS